MSDLVVLRAALGVDVPDGPLTQALTHRSYAYEHGGLPTNERLEFLGDSVLGLVVTDALYRAHPDLAEGQLAKLRASVVNMRALAAVARGLRLGDHLLLGRGEETTGGRDKPSLLADALEAVIGTVHHSLGLEEASALVRRLFDPVMNDAATLGAGLDWKTALQELAAAAGRGAPSYVVSEAGPDHAKRFTAVACVAGPPGAIPTGGRPDVGGTGEGGTKKQAEQRAAQQAYAELRALVPDDGSGAGVPPHPLADAGRPCPAPAG